MLGRTVGVLDGTRAEIDVRREELLNEGAECVRLRETRDLVPEFEFLEDVLDVQREAIEVGFKVGLSCC
jgi:hypothetical protein